MNNRIISITKQPYQPKTEDEVTYHRTIPVIGMKYLEAMFGAHLQYGITIYKGVIVIWDADYDTRILTFIDSMSKIRRKMLLAAGEYKGSLNLIWAGEEIPFGYEPDTQIDISESIYKEIGDVWVISFSESITSMSADLAGLWFPEEERS